MTAQQLLVEQLKDNLNLQAEIARLRAGISVETFIERNKRRCSNCDHEFIDINAYYSQSTATHFLVADGTEGVEAICAHCLNADHKAEIVRLVDRLGQVLDEEGALA